ncbi:MAG: hypothetical protein WAW82_14375 [Candidatus Lutibacillus vidarii]
MLMDCQTCPVRGQHCDECVVTVLLQIEGRAVLPLDEAERRAVSVFVEAGLVSHRAASRVVAERVTPARRAVG